MQRFRFGPDAAWPVTDYDSMFLLTRLLWSLEGEVRIDIAHLVPGARIGRHRAGLPQLFCVVTGSGWVQAEDAADASIASGEAVFWTAGEWHAVRTDDGLTALIIQAGTLDPERFLTSHLPDA